MTISLFQAILIGLWTAFCFSGMLLGLYTNRCIVLSFGVGIILGDIPTALAVGAISELAYMGFGVGAGGTVPPNPIGPGIFGTLMAITTVAAKDKITPEAALALSTPIAVGIQFIQTAVYTAFAGAPGAAKKALQKGDFKKFKIAANSTIWAFAVVGFLLGITGALSMDTLTKLFAMIPPVLLNGLTLAGKMLPAIGFAMILSVMAKKELIPYIILGYVLAVYFGLPVLTPTANEAGVLTGISTGSVVGIPTIGVALIATIFALIDIYKKPTTSVVENESEGDDHDDWI
ncbi:PTS mannose/fructose/sorbose/N-acetylgalactosamine transporter subunit IIC [Streptococcus parauberis]|uniref:PTS mannose/fructose/sorbose/N-acetylgalactosamine transporter subunit IIC n=1 Tax=Streptococcus parauberis TaxID=1348 RepID=UPI00020CC110|nr:PTS sugar transporter subunit IIC [Streptococcus parauberis]AEF25618.1 PTS system, IIC component [Streptococcus parauberis KCTC 11537]EMF50297.1 PTS system, N-acetylgalactosamine-specific IIC component [Streptococcus parauberis KRS-02109]ONH64612.1 N-acetylgalactosamine permease IIC component 1 [Streptococcus parauberis]PCH14593.1 N-acetylgalactosamine permease IIC component 1 [Streptococcus parauberis]PNY21063.1 N-acetylgalactosamine permease IIC component 1 [Streptococcus parauberis]